MVSLEVSLLQWPTGSGFAKFVRLRSVVGNRLTPRLHTDPDAMRCSHHESCRLTERRLHIVCDRTANRIHGTTQGGVMDLSE